MNAPPSAVQVCANLEPAIGDALCGQRQAAPSRTETAGRVGKESSFAGHVLLFSLANLAALLSNGLLAFLLPRWLSLESYGYYRLFILYGGFAGALHLGLLDGSLVRWAARPGERLPAEARSALIFLLLQQMALLVPVMIVLAVWYRHETWFLLVLAIALYALVSNAAVMGQFVLQAEKSFGLLSAVTAANPALLLGALVALHRWNRMQTGSLLAAYIATSLAAGLAVWIVLLVQYSGEKYPAQKYKSRAPAAKIRIKMKMKTAGYIWRVGAGNIRAGWGILLAGLVTSLAVSLDRIMVSLSFGIRDFAIYSLAATALAVVNTIIASVARVVFPYLSDGLSAEQKAHAYIWGESCLIALWAVSLAVFFPLRVLLPRYLPAYILSLPILRLLMLATGPTALIYILHSNYFRSSLRQTSLLLGASVGLLSAALLLALAKRSGNLENMAWAMLGAVVLWWTVDEWLLRDLTGKTSGEIGKTLFFFLACGGTFLLCAAVSSAWLDVLAYGGAAVFLTALVYGRRLHSFLFTRFLSLAVAGS
ncbi:MAG: hypothetical protein WAL56_01895 [Candidatus Sulfotelmatobacter sp.]